MVVKLFKIIKINEGITNMFENLSEHQKRVGEEKPDVKGLGVVEDGNEETEDALPPLPEENDEATEWLRKHEKGGGQMN